MSEDNAAHWEDMNRSNTVDLDQTVLSGAVWSGSAMFAYAIVSETLLYEILGHLLYIIRQTVSDKQADCVIMDSFYVLNAT